MSATARQKALMPSEIRAMKGGTPIVSLTAYTTPMAQMMDAHCDFVLVGDSVAMVQHGLASTLSATMEMMILHGQAVARGLETAMMVVDLPFRSFEESPEQAFRNAARMMAETGAGAIKLEGGEHMAETIHFLTRRGIPVMAHIGFTPQSVNGLGGFRVQGRGDGSEQLVADAIAVQEAGAFSVVMEMVPADIAGQVTRKLTIPTVGIGAGNETDAQVLVWQDMAGYTNGKTAKFVKKFGNVGDELRSAAAAYLAEVRTGVFPGPEHSY